MAVFACGQVIDWVDPFSAFIMEGRLGFKFFSWGLFCPAGVSFVFIPSGAFLEMKVSFFDSLSFLPFLGFSFQGSLRVSSLTLEGFFFFLLMHYWTSVCPLIGFFSPGF